HVSQSSGSDPVSQSTQQHTSSADPKSTMRPSTIQPATTKNSRRFGLQLLVTAILVILVIISFISSIEIYQNHLNQASNNATSTAKAKVTANAQALATAQHNSYLFSLSGNGKGTLAFVDPLNQESGSKWSNNTSGACQFTRGAYHVIEQDPKYFHSCLASG